jgi:hypothetical protein
MRLFVRRAVRGVSLCVLAVALAGSQGAWSASAQEAGTVYAIESAELREYPGYDAPALATLGGGEAAEVTGGVTMAADGSAWVPVVAAGQSGFLPAGIVSGTPPAGEAAVAEAPPSSEMPTTSEASSAAPVDTPALPAEVAPETAPAPVADAAGPGPACPARAPAAPPPPGWGRSGG